MALHGFSADGTSDSIYKKQGAYVESSLQEKRWDLGFAGIESLSYLGPGESISQRYL